MDEFLSREDILPSPLFEIEGFDLLINFALASRMRKAKLLIPTTRRFELTIVDKFNWRASDGFVEASYGDGKVKADEAGHAALHRLMWMKYGSSLKGHPLTALISEAVASNSELFFNLQCKAQGLLRDNEWMENPLKGAVHVFGEEHANARLKPLLNEGVADPFATYKACVLEMIEMYRLLLDGAREKQATGVSDVKERLAGFVREKKYAALYSLYDIGGNVLYALAFCGFQSSAEDERAFRDLQSALNASESFSGFLRALGIEKFIEKARAA